MTAKTFVWNRSHLSSKFNLFQQQTSTKPPLFRCYVDETNQLVITVVPREKNKRVAERKPSRWWPSRLSTAAQEKKDRNRFRDLRPWQSARTPRPKACRGL